MKSIIGAKRARKNWLKYGDCNSQYFHERAFHKKWWNEIKDDNYRWVTNGKEVLKAISRVGMSRMLTIPKAMILMTNELFVTSEMNEALFSMGPTKA